MRKRADESDLNEKQPHNYPKHPEHNYEKLPLPVKQKDDFYYDIEHKMERDEYGPGGPAGYVPPYEPLNQDNLTEYQINRFDTGPMDEWFDSGFGTGIFWIKGPGVQAKRGEAMKIASLLNQCITYLDKARKVICGSQDSKSDPYFNEYWNLSRVASEIERFLDGKDAVKPWETISTLEHAARSLERNTPLVAAHIDMVTNTLEKIRKFAESKSKEKVHQYGQEGSMPIRKRYDYGEPGSWEYETTHNADAEDKKLYNKYFRDKTDIRQFRVRECMGCHKMKKLAFQSRLCDDCLKKMQPELYKKTSVNPEEANKNYEDGYKNGHADHLVGRKLQVALSSHLPGYADGYHDGWYGFRKKPPYAKTSAQNRIAVPRGYPFGFTRPEFVTPETDDIWRQAIDRLVDRNDHLVQKKDGAMGPNISGAKEVYYNLLNSYAQKTEE